MSVEPKNDGPPPGSKFNNDARVAIGPFYEDVPTQGEVFAMHERAKQVKQAKVLNSLQGEPCSNDASWFFETWQNAFMGPCELEDRLADTFDAVEQIIEMGESMSGGITREILKETLDAFPEAAARISEDGKKVVMGPYELESFECGLDEPGI